MLGAPSTFWAKLSRGYDTDSVIEWHPLVDHCLDVGTVAETLLGIPVWSRSLARLAGMSDLDESCRARLSVLAALHDLGKFNLGFQAKARLDLGPTAGHVKEALAALGEQPVVGALQPLSGWGDGVYGLLVAAICHHGTPISPDGVRASWQAVRWQPREGLDPEAGVKELIDACRTCFPSAFAEGARPLLASPTLEHSFAGLVMLADWLASDPRFFPFREDGDSDRISFSRKAARSLLDKMGLLIDLDARLDHEGRNAFERIAENEYKARAAQKAVLSLPCDECGSISVVESETGSGKTEAALARFVSLFESGLVDGLYFALPTRTAATQIHRRVLAAVRRAFRTPPPVVLAVPGYLRVDDVEGRRLPGFEVMWPDRDEERFRYRAWAAENPKRYLVGTVVVGTVDQVLLSSLMVRHAHLRATSLLRHLLVIDEVHASDDYMMRIIEEVLARHNKAGGHALLLSATLGCQTRCRLLQAASHETSLPSFEQAESTPYPLVSHLGAAERAVEVHHDGRKREVEVTAAPWLEDSDAVATNAMDAACSAAKVLIIKNTVTDCIETQRAVEKIASIRQRTDLLFTCEGVSAPHHSRFARADRECLDRALESRLGKTRPDGGCVVVATQTVQQSLDIDADLLISDLCPMDVLLQRAGRLHRHERLRVPGVDLPRVTVLVPSSRDLGQYIRPDGEPMHHHGLGSVYPDLRILEATWRCIEESGCWQLPTMCRALVEHCLHSTALHRIVTEGGPEWEKHAARMIGATLGQKRVAELNLVDWGHPYSDTTFPSRIDQRIVTRLGEGDRIIRLGKPCNSPFGNQIGELVVRASLAGEATDEEEAVLVESGSGVTRFEFGGIQFIYDRLGLRLDNAPPREASDDDGP